MYQIITTHLISSTNNIKAAQVGEMVQWLKTLSVLPQDLSLFP